jgi:Tol biopolymer transport system component
MSWRLTLGLTILAAALVVVLLPSVSQARRSRGDGEIAFSARVHGISQVFTIRPNGTGQRQVTHSAYDVGQYGLAWSPNGSSLLYVVNGNGKGRKDQMVKSGANGSGATAISPPCTGTCLGDDNPTYSPNGTKITFERAFAPPYTGGNKDAGGIFTMNIDGSDLRQLTQASSLTSSQASSEDHEPRWSPNGKQIAFVRLNVTAAPQDESAIEVMNADGSDLRRITPWGMRATDPRWSPNGKRILFRTYGETVQFKDSNLFTMRANGTDRVELTHYSGGFLQAYPQDWSPDGTKIIFERFRYSGCCSKAGSFYILNLRSRKIRRLTAVRIVNYDAEAAWAK